MAIKRNKPEEIVTKLRQVEVLVGQGKVRRYNRPSRYNDVSIGSSDLFHTHS